MGESAPAVELVAAVGAAAAAAVGAAAVAAVAAAMPGAIFRTAAALGQVRAAHFIVFFFLRHVVHHKHLPSALVEAIVARRRAADLAWRHAEREKRRRGR